MKSMICIVCPKGCHINVDESTLAVSGNACERGAKYGADELTNPLRVVTSTVCIKNAAHRRCPVKTSTAIPKGLMQSAMQTLDTICLTAPVKCGDIIVKNVCGTNADFVATRDLDKE